MSYFILKRVQLGNAHGYKILRGFIYAEQQNIIVLNTEEGLICCHRSQLYSDYDAAVNMAQLLLCESYGEEI